MRLAFGAVVASWLLIASPWLFGGAIIPYDAQNYYFPVFRFFAETLAMGQSPAWNPFLLSGHPAIADPQSWYFTATARLWTLFDAAPTLHSFAAWQLLHLLAGGTGFLLLARRLGLTWPAAAFGAIVFMGGGQALGRLQHSLMVVGYAWLPWTLWALDACLRGPRRQRWWRGAVFGLLAAAMAVNRDHVAYLNCVLLVALTLLHLWRQGRRSRMLAGRSLVQLVPAAVTGGLLLCVPLLLTLEFVAISNRPAFDVAGAAHASLQPAAFLGLLVPDLFGALSARYWGPGTLPWMALSATGNDWTDDSISHLYLGAAPLLLLFARPWRTRRLRPYLVLFALMLLYALGGYTPAFAILHQWLPGVDLFRRPADAAFPLNLLLALAAAGGLARWQRGGTLAWLPLAAAVAAAGAAGLWLVLRFSHQEVALAALLQAVPWFATAAGLIVALRRWPVLAMGPALLVATDLYVHNAGLSYNAQPAAVADAFTPRGEALASRLDAEIGNGPYRAEIFGISGSWQNAALVYRLPQTLGYSPLRLAAYEEATGAAQNSHQMARRRPPGFGRYDDDLPRRLGIAVVATGEPLPDPAALGLVPAGQSDEAWLYRNPLALPLVMAEPGTVRIVRHTTTEIEVEAAMAGPGRVVLHVPRYPGWTAELDGAVRATDPQGLFQSIAVGEGRHRIRFAYQPFSLAARGGN
jgi:hypothetical protein